MSIDAATFFDLVEGPLSPQELVIDKCKLSSQLFGTPNADGVSLDSFMEVFKVVYIDERFSRKQSKRPSGFSKQMA